MPGEKTRVGVVVGQGSGEELADIFKKTVRELWSALRLGGNVEFVVFPPEGEGLHSYYSLKKKGLEEAKRAVLEDVFSLLEFYTNEVSRGMQYVFRTAIDAETLYKVRIEGKAVKVFDVEVDKYKRLRFVRDEMQGFYAVEKYEVEKYENEREEVTEVTFVERLSLQRFIDILSFVKSKYDPKNVWAIYKYHLFGNLVEDMIYKASRKVGLTAIEIFQPDTGIEKLIYGIQGKEDLPEVVVVANEVGDIIYEFLIHHLEIGNRFTLWTKNVYLSESLKGLVEYQTVHGSADEIAGTGKVNPIATMLAAVHLVSSVWGNEKIYDVAFRISKSIDHETTSKTYESFLHQLVEETVKVETSKVETSERKKNRRKNTSFALKN